MCSHVSLYNFQDERPHHPSHHPQQGRNGTKSAAVPPLMGTVYQSNQGKANSPIGSGSSNNLAAMAGGMSPTIPGVQSLGRNRTYGGLPSDPLVPGSGVSHTHPYAAALKAGASQHPQAYMYQVNFLKIMGKEVCYCSVLHM